MRLLGVFPGVLHYSKIFLRLEPIGLEPVSYTHLTLPTILLV